MGGYFAGIGGQKCGTSWLARYLYTQPVLNHPIKECTSSTGCSGPLRHIIRNQLKVNMARHFDRYLTADAIAARSTFEITLASLDEVVPPEQALTLFYEDLFDPDDDVTLRRITGSSASTTSKVTGVPR